jgi:autotransporter-associated beta strand protein
VTKAGAGKLTLSGTNSYQVGTTVQAGTLVITNAQSLPASSPLIVQPGGVFVFDPSVVNALVAGPFNAVLVAYGRQ